MNNPDDKIDLAHIEAEGTQTMRMDRVDLKVLSVKCSEASELWAKPDETSDEEVVVAEPSLEQRMRIRRQTRYSDPKMIGEGANGKVYSLRDNNCNRNVAIKVPKQPSFAAKTEEVRRFILEAGVAAGLEHPSIVPIYDLNCDERGRVYMSMRRIAGYTLKDAIRDAMQGKTTPELRNPGDYVRAFLKVCDALAYAHANGHVHQDVKPENIMIGKFGEVFVIDWGAAASGVEISLTPVYMSPAQANGEIATPSDDVFCLGATLFHCLMLRFPTMAESLEELWEKRKRGILNYPTAEEKRKIPAPLLAVIMKALEADPANRYGSIAELAGDLRRYQEGVAVSAHQYSFREIVSASYRRHKAALRVGAVAVCVFLLVTGFFSKRALTERRARLDAQKTALADREARLLAEEERIQERQARIGMERQQQEGWITVAEWDFAKETQLDPRFDVYELNHRWKGRQTRIPAPELAQIQDGRLVLMTHKLRTALCWKEGIPEDTRLEVVLEHTPTLNLELTVSGGLSYGYRLRLARDFGRFPYLCLSKYDPNYEELQLPEIELDENRDSIRIEFWRSGHRFFAAVDGKTVLDYYDPLAVQGAKHRTFTIGTDRDLGENTVIRSIAVRRRRHPEYVDVLEPARVLMRQTAFETARDVLAEIIKTHSDPRIREEAEFLVAASYDNKREADKGDAAFLRIIAQNEHSFRTVACRVLALRRIWRKDVKAGIEAFHMMKDPHTRTAEWVRISHAFRARLMHSKKELRPDYLRHISTTQIDRLIIPSCKVENLDVIRQLPLKDLNLNGNRIDNLKALRGLELNRLRIDECGISSLEPLRNAPLRRLYASRNDIKDLRPLAQSKLQILMLNDNGLTRLSGLEAVPLRFLAIARNGITQLPGFQSEKLKVLDISENKVADLSPLSSVRSLKELRASNNPLRNLNGLDSLQLTQVHLNRTGIRDILPLAGQPLNHLAIADNRITDLGPLQASKVQYLNCDRNAITSLNGLQGTPLKELSCEDNQITDLTPLADCRLVSLNCNGNPIQSLRPLRGQPITQLSIRGVKLSADDLEVLKSLPLVELTADLQTPGMSDLLRNLPLKLINGIDAELALKVLPATQTALDQWHQREQEFCSPQQSLRPLASSARKYEYLIVPVHLTFDQARAFATWQKARLADFRYGRDLYKPLRAEIRGSEAIWVDAAVQNDQIFWGRSKKEIHHEKWISEEQWELAKDPEYRYAYRFRHEHPMLTCPRTSVRTFVLVWPKSKEK